MKIESTKGGRESFATIVTLSIVWIPSSGSTSIRVILWHQVGNMMRSVYKLWRWDITSLSVRTLHELIRVSYPLKFSGCDCLRNQPFVLFGRDYSRVHVVRRICCLLCEEVSDFSGADQRSRLFKGRPGVPVVWRCTCRAAQWKRRPVLLGPTTWSAVIEGHQLCR